MLYVALQAQQHILEDSQAHPQRGVVPSEAIGREMRGREAGNVIPHPLTALGHAGSHRSWRARRGELCEDI